MEITAQLFEAYLECPTKCWLRARGGEAVGNAYAKWVRLQNESYCNESIKRLLEGVPVNEREISPPTAEGPKSVRWRLAVDLMVHKHDLQSCLHAVERVPSEGRGKPAQFIPIRFMFRNKVSKNDKLLLAFDAVVLSEAFRRTVDYGKIIHGDDRTTLKVRISTLSGDVRKFVEKIAALLSISSPPDLVLNRHCAECEFQAQCRKKAIERDDLSLLATMTEKERRKFHTKGVFTVTQLSHTFRPRRRSRRAREKREKYHHSLKALAIREGKVHIVGSPELRIEGTPVYLDVEGLPDHDFYYLIGVRFKTVEETVQHSLWADTREEEKRIWIDFLGILSEINNPVLIHYGSYETFFLRRMREIYGEPVEGTAAAKAIRSPINILSVVYAQIYFPTFSNSLKDIANFLGFEWSEETMSGVRAIALRHEWEVSKEGSLKQALLTYNTQDCKALEVVANKLVEFYKITLNDKDVPSDEVVLAAMLKREHPYGFKRNTFVFPELDVINNAAYWDYQRERVYVKSSRKPRAKSRRVTNVKKSLVPDKTIECHVTETCSKCGSKSLYTHQRKAATVIDLKFMANGIKKSVVCYKFRRYKCNVCRSTFSSRDRCLERGKFGPGLIAYALYQNIELRMSQGHVDRNLNKFFGLQLASGTTGRIRERAARSYEDAYNTLLERLCHGQLLHVDETKVSVKGKEGYVWVFTSIEEVAYVYSETRESDLLKILLKDFKGVLVTSFHTNPVDLIEGCSRDHKIPQTL